MAKKKQPEEPVVKAVVSNLGEAEDNAPRPAVTTETSTPDTKRIDH